MAFQQPSPLPARRLSAAKSIEGREIPPKFAPAIRQRAFDDASEWILFPSTQERSSTTLTAGQTSSEQSPHATSLSRVSDFGSLNTAARSTQDTQAARQLVDGISVDQDEERDQDLDSLDEGLPAFHAHEPSRLLSEYFHPSSSILPRHDGFGGFPTSTPGLGDQRPLDLQSQDNASRKRSFDKSLRRPSVEGLPRVVPKEANDGNLLDAARRERIELWRMEHSKVLLKEVEKATKKKRAPSAAQNPSNGLRRSGVGLPDAPGSHSVHELHGYKPRDTAPDTGDLSASQRDSEDKSGWQQIARRIIYDFIGINDDLLSVILGEALPPVKDDSCDDRPKAKVPRLDKVLSKSEPTTGLTWNQKLLDRLARELGILFQHLSEHPGAFSVVPASDPPDPEHAELLMMHSIPHEPIQDQLNGRMKTRGVSAMMSKKPPLGTSSSISFEPTLRDPQYQHTSAATSSHAALWGVEGKEISSASQKETLSTKGEEDHAYWESPPNIKTIFQRFIYTQFNSSTSGSPPPPDVIDHDENPFSSTHQQQYSRHHHTFPDHAPTTPQPSTQRNLVATTSTPDSLRRAALIRQYHPLTNRTQHQNHHRRRKTNLRGSHQYSNNHGNVNGNPIATAASVAVGSSCASESLRRYTIDGREEVSSMARSSLSLTNSRNYWDLGGGSQSSHPHPYYHLNDGYAGSNGGEAADEGDRGGGFFGSIGMSVSVVSSGGGVGAWGEV